MYTTIRADSIRHGFVIHFHNREWYVVRVIGHGVHGGFGSFSFVAKPVENQYPRPFILEANAPLFSKGIVKFKHSHYWS